MPHLLCPGGGGELDDLGVGRDELGVFPLDPCGALRGGTVRTLPDANTHEAGEPDKADTEQEPWIGQHGAASTTSISALTRFAQPRWKTRWLGSCATICS